MPATFDGINLIITLESGVFEVDTEPDLYSEWKKWAILPDNIKFPEAFRGIAGDPLTPGLEAAPYFFLNNAEGWRIRPPEENISIIVGGNLVPEDASLPMVVPTIGAFTALLLGLQPITQSVAELLVLQQDTLYQGSVHIDTASGVAGTGFPIGTASDPVSNLPDAILIANDLGLRSFVLSGEITLNQAFRFWDFQGKGAHAHLDINGQDVSGSKFTEMQVEGSMVTTTHEVWFIDSEIEATGVTNFRGSMVGCYLNGNVSLGGDSTFVKCSSNIAGVGVVQVNCQSNALDVSVRGWVGGMELLNFDQAGNDASVDLASGRLILGATVSAGTVVVRGVGHLDDANVGAATVVKDGMIDGVEIELIKQITAGNVTIDPDDLGFTVFAEDGVTPLQVYTVSADGRLRAQVP